MENKIKECRIEQGLTQAELAKKSGVARTIIVQLENGTRDVVTSKTMISIARGLNSTVDEIFLF